MSNKAIIASAVLAASTGLAFANGGTYVQPTPCVHSCYVGVAVSRDFFNLSNDNNHNNWWGHRHHHWNYDNVDLGNDGWNGELNAGIGWVFQDHYYAGVEVFGSVANTKIQVGGFEIKNKYMYGIDFVPGVKISDSTMLYGKIGYVRGGFSNNWNNWGFNWNHNHGNSNRNGLQLGIGLETMVTNNVSAKLEYDYNYFSKFSNRNWGGNNFRPTVDVVKLGVAYHFMEA